jgi:DNA repair exonuclease SbcCD nuclease subunit
MFKFLHVADIHLDSPLKGLEVYQDAPVDQIRGAARRAFDNLIDLAIDEGVAFVLLAGDLYDGPWKDYNTGIYFVSRMGRLREAGIPVFMVSGNHDAASQITRALKLPDNVTLFSNRKCESRVLDNLGVVIHGQSFSSQAVAEDLTQNYPQGNSDYFNIGLLHTSLTGRPGHEPYAPCTIDALRSKGYQYWALGHVHQREEVASDPWIVFSGNIQGRHIRETGAKGCTLVSVEDGCIVSVEARELDVLRWSRCQLDLSKCDKPESLLELVRETFESERALSDGRPLIVRLVLCGTTALHGKLHENLSHWQEEFRAVAASLGDVWLEKIVFNTRKEQQLEAEFADDSPLAALQKSVESMTFESSRLLDLIPDFEQLRSKLPPDLLSDDNPFSPDGEELATLREDVKDLLTAKIQQGGRHAH